MSSKKEKKFIREQFLIKTAQQYRKDFGDWPDRRKLAKLSKLSLGTVSGVIREIEKSTGKLYVHNLTHVERGALSKLSREGKNEVC